MNILKVLQIIAVISTILVGILSLFWPKAALNFTGLASPGGRGISEVRAVFGGLFIGLGIAVFLLGTREAYQMLGIMYLAIGAVRAVSMLIDKSVDPSNLISLAAESFFGVILVL